MRRKEWMLEGRKQFTFYRSYFEALQKLPQSLRLGVLEAIIGYALDGTEPENLSDMQAMAFLLIRPTLDAGLRKAQGGVNSGKTRRRCREESANKGEMEEEKEYEREKENEKENEIEDESLYPAGFEEFWDLYPVKLGKDAALDAWKRRRPDPETICNGVRQWRQTKQWCSQQGRFIPRAAKFIQEEHDRYLPEDYIPKGASGVLGKAELEAIESIMGR